MVTRQIPLTTDITFDDLPARPGILQVGQGGVGKGFGRPANTPPDVPPGPPDPLPGKRLGTLK